MLYINANHVEMCRFWGVDDPKYEEVTGELAASVQQIIVQANGQ